MLLMQLYGFLFLLLFHKFISKSQTRFLLMPLAVFEGCSILIIVILVESTEIFLFVYEEFQDALIILK